jgi:DNA-binding MarR family transcriptional regulator
MALEQELGLKKGFEVLSHEAILNIYYTTSLIKKQADEFFSGFGLTDVQFNVLMLLHHQSSPEEGLSQVQLSDKMLVNRANITSLIDRMEKAGLVVRTAAAEDRRYNIVKMTGRGRKLFAGVEPLYAKQVKKIMACLKDVEQKRVIAMLEKVRSKLVK